ncbi:protoporphyrinogen/coproporphyrinogen oxidase [Galactobacter valiniphilus]|uniref:protoporphyrinogen/coproporphyrinogen oxidase n=1 Tax=Galactobacter valiniphilus TaxID=2676122 RepID=UPI001F3D45B6|nr:FAD-dependent oxidoreductase [Galactobacter valiniphilus]
MSRLTDRLQSLAASRKATVPSQAPAAVVLGAGVAGLVAARELALLGYEVSVLEAGEPGGRVSAHVVDGLSLDAGAESFATRNDAVARLAGELGLEIVYPAPSPAWLHAGPGRDVPLPRSGVVGIPGDPREADAIAALSAEGAARAVLDLETPVQPELLEGPVSLGELVRVRLGQEVLETLVTPVVSGVHSADPEALDADAIAPGLRAALEREGSLSAAAASLRAAAPAGSAVAGLRGGMNTLVTALVADLQARGVHLITGAEVEHVEREENGAWHVSVGSDVLDAERLVVATDGPRAVELLSGAVPGLAALRPEEGAGVSLVTLVVDLPDLDVAPRGTGVLVAPGAPDVVAKALTHATAKWPWLAELAGPGRHVLRLSYGRLTDEAARVADADDETLLKQGLADAATLLGVQLGGADVLGWDVVRHHGALPMATLGHRDRLQAISGLLAPVPELDVVGAWRYGTGLAAVVSSTRQALGLSAR